MSKQKIFSVFTRGIFKECPVFRDAKDPVRAVIRGQYYLHNITQLQTIRDFLEKHHLDTNAKSTSIKDILDLKSLEQRMIISQSIMLRELIKYNCQEVLEAHFPEDMQRIRDRLAKMYNSQPDPTKDPEGFAEWMIQKLSEKSVGEVRSVDYVLGRIFGPGGGDIVPKEVASFGSCFGAEAYKAQEEGKKELREIITPEELIAEVARCEAEDGYKHELKLPPDISTVTANSNFGGDASTHTERAYKRLYLNEILQDQEFKETINGIITTAVNGEISDTIKTVDDMRPESLAAIQRKVIDSTKDEISGNVGNAISSISGITQQDNSIFRSVMVEIQNGLTKYIPATIGLAIDHAVQTFMKQHIDEVQSKVADLSRNISDTTNEQEALQKQLKELTDHPDPRMPQHEIEEKKEELQKEIDAKTAELKKTQEYKDTFDDEKMGERKSEYEKERKGAWSEGGEHIMSVLSVNGAGAGNAGNSLPISEENIKKFDGNVKDTIAAYLRQNKGATKSYEVTDSLDTLYQEYSTSTASKVGVLVVDDIFECTTVITSADLALLGDIANNIHTPTVSLVGSHSVQPNSESAHYDCCNIL